MVMSKYKNIKRLTYRLMHVAEPGDTPSFMVDIFIQILIVSNVISVILETIEPLYQPYKLIFDSFDLFSVIIFSIEYILRVWSYTEDPKYKHPLKGRLKLIKEPMLIIDFLAVAPFYLIQFVQIDLRFVRILRLFRLLRILKMARYIKAMQTLLQVIVLKKEELFIGIFAFLMVLIFTSSIIYIIEYPHQPDVFSSIPATMWWAMAALTTVGYGDMLPITPLGKFLGAFASFFGIAIFALPTGILVSGMIQLATQKKDHQSLCENCKKEISSKSSTNKKNI